MIIHSHKKHISLQILHWTRNDVVVQCSFTRVCQGVPNKMLGASYTNRDVSSFQTRDLYCNGRNMYVQLSHLLFVLEMFRWYVVLDKFVSYSRRQWTSFFSQFQTWIIQFLWALPICMNKRVSNIIRVHPPSWRTLRQQVMGPGIVAWYSMGTKASTNYGK